MLWAHQGPQSMLVSTVGVWHLTLCRASFWTMQSVSKEFNCQDKQSVGWNHTAKKHHSQWDKCWTGLPSGGESTALEVSYLVVATFLRYKQQQADHNIRERPNAVNRQKQADCYRNNNAEPSHCDGSDRALLPMRDVSKTLECLSVQFITSLKYLWKRNHWAKENCLRAESVNLF